MIKDFSLIDLVLFYIPCDEFAALIGVVKFNLELNNIFYKMEFVTSYIQAKNVELSNIYLRCIIHNVFFECNKKVWMFYSTNATYGLVKSLNNHIQWIKFGGYSKYKDGKVDLDMEALSTYDGKGECQALFFAASMGSK